MRRLYWIIGLTLIALIVIVSTADARFYRHYNHHKRYRQQAQQAVVQAAAQTTVIQPEEKQLLDEINNYRMANNLPALSCDPILTKAAQIRASRMATQNYFSHLDPDDRLSLYHILSRNHYRWSKGGVGENLAAQTNSPHHCVELWDGSHMGHREMMLGTNFTRVGCGYAYVLQSEYKNYWVALFSP